MFPLQLFSHISNRYIEMTTKQIKVVSTNKDRIITIEYV